MQLYFHQETEKLTELLHHPETPSEADDHLLCRGVDNVSTLNLQLSSQYQSISSNGKITLVTCTLVKLIW